MPRKIVALAKYFPILFGLIILAGCAHPQTIDRKDGLKLKVYRTLHDSSGEKVFYTVRQPLEIYLPHDKGGILQFRIWNDFHPTHQVIANKLITPFYVIDNVTSLSDLRGSYLEYPGSWGPAGGKEVTLEIPSGTQVFYFHATGSQTSIEISDLSFNDKPVQPTRVTLASGGTVSSSPGKGYAVIVGISKYRHSGKGDLTNLIYADYDGKAFAQALKNKGWSESHIKSLINERATKRNIEIALESWLTKAGPNDLIVLYWSGHGFPDPENPEKVYFACYDTQVNIPATGYRMDRVRDALEERKARNVVVLADTCHAGKLITRGTKGISIVPSIARMQREKNIPKGWIFMVGADTDRLAIENSSWSNGAFTHCLLQGINGKADGYESVGLKDGIVTMGELRAYLYTAMPDETQKVLGVAKRPVITTSTGDPDIWNLTLYR